MSFARPLAHMRNLRRRKICRCPVAGSRTSHDLAIPSPRGELHSTESPVLFCGVRDRERREAVYRLMAPAVNMGPKAFRRMKVDCPDMERWAFHDLRRTWRTLAAKAEIGRRFGALGGEFMIPRCRSRN